MAPDRTVEEMLEDERKAMRQESEGLLTTLGTKDDSDTGRLSSSESNFSETFDVDEALAEEEADKQDAADYARESLEESVPQVPTFKEKLIKDIPKSVIEGMVPISDEEAAELVEAIEQENLEEFGIEPFRSETIVPDNFDEDPVPEDISEDTRSDISRTVSETKNVLTTEQAACNHNIIQHRREGYILGPNEFLNEEGMYRIRQAREFCPKCEFINSPWENVFVKGISHLTLDNEIIRWSDEDKETWETKKTIWRNI